MAHANEVVHYINLKNRMHKKTFASDMLCLSEQISNDLISSFHLRALVASAF